MKTQHQSNTVSEIALAKAQLVERLQDHPSVCGIGEGQTRDGKATLTVFLTDVAPELEQHINKIAGHAVKYFVSGRISKLATSTTWGEASLPVVGENSNK
jgi:hypothetical protein